MAELVVKIDDHLASRLSSVAKKVITAIKMLLSRMRCCYFFCNLFERTAGT